MANNGVDPTIIQWLIGGFATIMVSTITGLLIGFGRAMSEKDKLHASELKRSQDSCTLELERRDKSIKTLEADLTANRLYAAGLEAEKGKSEDREDALQWIAGDLRDKCSMLQTACDIAGVKLPEEKRNKTKPLNAMVADRLAQMQAEKENKNRPA